MMQQRPGMAPPQMDPAAAAAAANQQHYQQPLPPQQQQQYGQHQGWMMQPPPQPQQYQQPAMWGQQPPQQPQQHYQQASQTQPTNPEDVRTLWIGDLQHWMDENYIANCFPQPGEVVSVKIIRNKQTQQSECYGFIEFASRAVAERVLQTYNGQLMPTVEQNFRLNWAFYGAGEKRQDESAEHTIFVGDLAADVTDYMLQETFRARYQSVKGAKVVIDRLTGRTKGYGFVRFSDESEQLRAMTEMNGVFCSTRPMRVGAAANKKPGVATGSYSNNQGPQGDSDPNNTTIFVGNLDASVTDEHLRQVFSPYGELVHVKIPIGKRCGFVQFVNRSSAEEALRVLNGTQLGGQNVRLSWGRSPSNKQQPQAEVNQWNAGYYGYPQPGYENYGYGAHPPAQDPHMYYGGGYTGYANYAVPQQQPQQQPVHQQQ